ncbi:PREDICTED: LOW QUALITY PROTEIN: F-box/LRR-repeat protein At4g14096 [Camelina sativa]|uniref:LOW QUALITY PROTEIN: F-box/LRR-repeat protein At4g14096 n=1 Tax=Camelina sativa TaxID=90675 RepID=A0ABM1RPY2_CAMSA|nr:PREDICTED: LOW QUALITY PROTEIN: F-box/LRR-repeat protein At4g14096 [Camelina sativa]
MNLDFDDSKRMHSGVRKQERDNILRSFTKRVDGTLALYKNVPLNRFSLKCIDDVGPAPVIGWITNVLKRRVSELVLEISSCWEWPMSAAIVRCDTMVHEFWESCSVSSTSLKRLTFRFNQMFFENHKSVSFDTPNLLYLEYSDVIADKYPKANFDSLVEARLDLQMRHDQIHEAKFSEDDLIKHEGLVGNAAVLFIGICNVEVLYLSYNTLEVMFQGLLHRDGMKCQSSDECLCKPWKKEDIPTCLSSSPVKVLTIMKFGDIYEDEDMDRMMDQVKYFLETMPNLEKLIIGYETSIDEDVEEVFSQFQMVPMEGLTNCMIQVISDNLALSTV